MVIRARRLRWAGYVVRIEGRSAFKILADTLIGKRPLGRPRRRWEEIFEWTLNKEVSVRRIILIRLRIGITGELL